MLTEQGWCLWKKAKFIKQNELKSEFKPEYYYNQIDILSSAAMTYGSFSSYIRYLHAYNLIHYLDKAEKAQPHTEFLVSLNNRRPSHMSLHAQALYQQHNCEYVKIDKQQSRACHKHKNCSKTTLNWIYWRLEQNTKNSWCSAPQLRR